MSLSAKRIKKTHGKAVKRHPKANHKSDNHISFNDDEPLGENILGEEEELPTDRMPSFPPLTSGKESTKPTPYDRLPWKTVQLPDFISDGLTFEADGGMLGLEELDGSLWNNIKLGRHTTVSAQSQISEDDKGKSEGTSVVDTLEPAVADCSVALQPSQQQFSAEPDKATHEIARLARKQAKKERFALIRRQNQEQQKECKKPAASPDPLTKTGEGHNTPLDGPENVEWSAVADLAPFSDMEDVDQNAWSNRPFEESLLPAWSDINLASSLKRALHALSFTKPTPVQEASLPISLCSQDSPRDLVVIAETGSGKTLAYGLPIINALTNPQFVSEWGGEKDEILPIKALILTPTRELCLQVKKHLDSVLKEMCAVDKDPPILDITKKNRTGISTVSICGGIAVAKQRKQLERAKGLMEPGRGGRGCIVIATPGRLWDLIQSWQALAHGIKRKLEWLVIDEADKMVEKGHFEELTKILKLTKRSNSQKEDNWKDEWVGQQPEEVKENIRTMVFSATMDKSLQVNLKKHWGKRGANAASNGKDNNPVQDLLEMIDFRDEEPELIDLTPQGRMVEALKECKIECVLKDKDLYMFHFLLRYSGRTIIFVSSISALRRLAPLLTLLFPQSKVLTLHSEMQQRARLKSLDKFRSTSNTILLSTDVAARGLDIPLVDHVIHYQVPRTVDCYVHRSGRTARAGREGVALVLIGPDEVKAWKSLMKTLGRVDDLPSPPIEHTIDNQLKNLLELAKRIDAVEHKSNKQAYEENWVKQTAGMIEVDLDTVNNDSNEEGLSSNKRESKQANAQVRRLKAELKDKLDEAIILKGVVVKKKKNCNRAMGNCYITDPDLMETLMKGDSHEKVIGLNKHVNAVEDLGRQRNKRKRIRNQWPGCS